MVARAGLAPSLSGVAASESACKEQWIVLEGMFHFAAKGHLDPAKPV